MVIPIKVTQPSYSAPTVTICLIVINILVYLHQFWLSLVDPYSLNRFMEVYSLVPAHFSIANVFTAMFVHASWFHVLGNMLFLWVFGDNVEDILGHAKYLIFYLACGFAAAMAQVGMDPMSRVPMVGASGAIAGVMGAYLLKFPRSHVVMLFFLLFIFTFDVPAWLMLIYWFAIQIFGGFGSITEASQGGTAFLAHVGGFVAGMLLINAMHPRERYWRRRDLYW
ncbi:MAG TPA: rhomboid family intramembrane serine protease [Bryobacteraceae bacterium]|jgi:membrane associated rhomboid family serine protease|nr:rhomboid family intramembrane serine protease [Bryobacteraceae bacterium]